MLEKSQHGSVTCFVMGRTMGDGTVYYTMACYLVDGLLIDSGPRHTGQEFLEALQPYSVQQLLNTHHHEDHIGNNRLLLEHFCLPPAWAHSLGLTLIKDPHPWAQKMHNYRQIAWGEPEPSDVKAAPSSIHTSRYEFEVLHTPGHSPDHIVLLERNEGWLFTGDVFISERLNTIRSDEDANEMIRSLKRLVKEPFDTIFCASGAIRSDAKQAIKAKLEYWLEIREKSLSLQQQGYTVDRIVEAIFNSESSLSAISGGDMSRANLVRSFLREAE